MAPPQSSPADHQLNALSKAPSTTPNPYETQPHKHSATNAGRGVNASLPPTAANPGASAHKPANSVVVRNITSQTSSTSNFSQKFPHIEIHTGTFKYCLSMRNAIKFSGFYNWLQGPQAMKNTRANTLHKNIDFSPRPSLKKTPTFL